MPAVVSRRYGTMQGLQGNKSGEKVWAMFGAAGSPRRCRKTPEAPRPRLNRFDESELLQGGYAVVQADFLDDLAVFEAEHSRTGEAHFPASRSRQRSNQE